MKKDHWKRLSSGFTLVEVLMALTISGLLFGLGVAKYIRFNRHQMVFQAARDLEANLRLAQNKALAGEKPVGWCDGSGEFLDGYQLCFISLTEYTTEAVCSDLSVELVRTVDFSGGGKVTGPTGECVFFKVLTQGVVEEKEFLIQGFGVDEKVMVESGGNIFLNES